MFNRGDIIVATSREVSAGFHYIIYYNRITGEEFAGTFITRTSYHGRNIPMQDIHFIERDANGELYQIQNLNSFFIPAKLIKLESWGPFFKVGELSQEGIALLESTIDHLTPMDWNDLARDV
ncbi:MAG: hypothetical protein VXW38_13170 [Bacteroidota bacterium]|nr:hypothetical protein [Bacteroidota bacterium]